MFCDFLKRPLVNLVIRRFAPLRYDINASGYFVLYLEAIHRQEKLFRRPTQSRLRQATDILLRSPFPQILRGLLPEDR